MVTFRDGPAKGQTLMLRRAPVLLRAVVTPAGEWNALDLLEDTPAEDEAVTVYVRATPATAVHLLVRGRGGRREGGWYQSAEYRIFEEQPAPVITRDNTMWREWCELIRKRMPRLAEPGGASTNQPGVQGS
jgi:hypothetical protein